MIETRKYTKKILEFVDEDFLNKKILIRDLLNWMDESDVQEFYKHQNLNEIEDLEED